MPKHPNNKSKQSKRDESMNGAMKFFLAGCVAELYLLIVRRFYVNGTARQQIAWYDNYLKLLIGAGIVILVLGLVLGRTWRQSKGKHEFCLYAAGTGAFLAISSALALWSMSSVSPMSVIVPVAMLLGVLWGLYDRECSLSLTILVVSLFVLWAGRRQVASAYLGTYAKIMVVICLVALAAIALLLKQGKLAKLLPAKADFRPVYMSCGLSFIAVLTVLFSASIAYYSMWVLAIVVFALAVYYTVKQL